MIRGRSLMLGLGAVLAVGILLSGCERGLPDAGSTPTATPAATALPPGVTVSVFQTRFDYSVRRLEVEVTNGTTDTITILSVTLDSTRFVADAVWDRGQDIPAGSARDLPVDLADPACDGRAPEDRVIVAYRLADGSEGRASVVPADEQARLATISEQDCLAAGAASVAAIEPATELIWTPGARQPAVLHLTVTPTGRAGSFVLHSASGTVLLALGDAAGAPIEALQIESRMDAASPTLDIPLALIPNRCDSHAVAEDKRGTFFPLDIELDSGSRGTVYIPVSPAVKAQLYAFYGDYCGFP